MPKQIKYADAGVDRLLRAESKKALQIFRKTYRFSRYGKVMQLPYGKLVPVDRNRYLDLQIEGVGTKVLVAQLAGKFDTIGIDGVAMAVNDVIRSGARPFALVDNIHAQVSDPDLTNEWIKGITRGAVESECVVPGGEIGDVADLIRGISEGRGFDMIVAALGDVDEEGVILGNKIKANDTIIGLRSSGIHSNGVSLARKILFKQWGGRYEPHEIPEGLDMEIALEVLKPTKIYVKPLLKTASMIKIKAAVHITGDAYGKFDKLTQFSPGIGFRFDNFDPQLVFRLIKKTAVELGCAISDEEMFRTFNMGWGFALIIDKEDADETLDILEKMRVHAERIGTVTQNGRIEIHHENHRIILN
jgi:phosphoribosylformylglycinamidine cyclo-ligase